MKKFLMAAGAAAMLSGLAAPASAAVLTFEGHANQIYTAPIVREGFELGNLPGEEQHFHEIDSNGFGLASNGTGVLLNDRDTSIFLRAFDLSNFMLTSFDIAASFGNFPGASFSVKGYLDDVLTGEVTGDLGEFASFSGAALGTVDYVVFDGLGGDGGFELDNVALNEGTGAIPEPATWAMMLMGFGAMGALIRRRTAVAA